MNENLMASSAFSAQRTPKTIAQELQLSGVGLHTGVDTQVRILPAQAGEGRYFVRVDLEDPPKIPAGVASVRQTLLSTELANGAATVRTVEHLLAALVSLGVDHARIELNGPEVPLLDGSALPWVEAIAQVGTVAIASTPTPTTQKSEWVLPEPIWVRQEDAFVAALPSPTLRFTYGIDFDLPAIGQQWYTWIPAIERFEDAIAPARTFGLLHQIESLRAAGLIKGGSLENALVCGEQGWLNPPLRFANEPVRHKILDLVGDLSLLSQIPCAHFLAYKASHNLHVQLTQRILDFGFSREESGCW